MQFKVEAFHNPYLPTDSRRVDAILTVSSGGARASRFGRTSAEGLIVDVSGSMQGERLQAVKVATRKAIDLLSDSSLFFVIVFNHEARVLHPLSHASPANKASAQNAVQQLMAGGSTRMSQGLAFARQEFLRAPDAVRHALFLTDGKNAPEDEGSLHATLAICEGAFQCDCRGVGTDWQPSQLRRIASKLLGSAQIIPDPSGMEADFRATISQALTRGVDNVRLRLWTPKTARILSCKQMSPDIADLTLRGVRLDAQTWEFPTGAWGDESRDYYVAFEVEGGTPGDEMLACRATMIHAEAGEELKAPPALVLATWTENEVLSARIEPQVAHYTGQEELAETIRLGLQARESGNAGEATALLGRAVKLAHASGNDETTRRLSKVVDVVDADAGTVRLKASVHKADEMDLDLMSTRTKRAARD